MTTQAALLGMEPYRAHPRAVHLIGGRSPAGNLHAEEQVPRQVLRLRQVQHRRGQVGLRVHDYGFAF